MNENSNFPEGFLWGSATSAFQVEGSTENNDWAEAGRAGKVPVIGRACDSYNRYNEDFDIAKSLGQNAHRFSIEWSRIEPEEGRFDENEIDHYRKVIQALRDRGLEPFVTLWHFTLPIWFSKIGGFENRKSPEIFSRYCEYVVSKLGDMAKFWITINEPMVYIGQGFSYSVWPPFKRNLLILIRVSNKLIMSHNLVYKRIKQINKNLQIGIAADRVVYFSNYNPRNIIKSKFLNWFRNHRFLNKIKNYQDFIGINYYRPIKFGIKLDSELTDMGWEIYPKGIYNVLLELKKYNKPIYVTENGIADAKDTKRAKYIKDHLYWVHRAIHDGADVRGYFYWSLIDNFEWAFGFEPRFGLVEMDYETLERRIRPSAYEYKKICQSNF